MEKQEKCNNIQLEIDLDSMNPVKNMNSKADSKVQIRSNKELEKYHQKKNFKINSNLEKELPSGPPNKQKQPKSNLLPSMKKNKRINNS